jgi:D-alanine-D-alanine ligase
MKKNVAILFGGQSTEHEVSRVSATSVLSHIDSEKYNVFPIGITKDGKWFQYKGEYKNIASGQWENDEENKIAHGLSLLINKEVDVVFPVLHGMYGEDGTIQGLCKLMTIPCVGPSVMSSAVCMDKIYTKYVLEHGNIKQARYVVVTAFEYERNSEKFISEIATNLGYPCFVKPANSGSSVGITKAHDGEELKKGLEIALKHDRKVLVEEGLNAREIEVSVLGNDDPKASTPGEIIPAKEFYDYEAKYQSEASKLLIPAALSEEKLELIKELAVKIYKKLDCSGMARVDFLVDKETEEVYLNEVNTIPGFTSISMYPKMWAASGLPYPSLIDELIQLAIERNNK